VPHRRVGLQEIFGQRIDQDERFAIFLERTPPILFERMDRHREEAQFHRLFFSLAPRPDGGERAAGLLNRSRTFPAFAAIITDPAASSSEIIVR